MAARTRITPEARGKKVVTWGQALLPESNDWCYWHVPHESGRVKRWTMELAGPGWLQPVYIGQGVAGRL